jgi:hypothetical protein
MLGSRVTLTCVDHVTFRSSVFPDELQGRAGTMYTEKTIDEKTHVYERGVTTSIDGTLTYLESLSTPSS